MPWACRNIWAALRRQYSGTAGCSRRQIFREARTNATQLPSGLGRSRPEESSMPKSRTKLAAVLPRSPTPRLALSIPEFCEAHGISEGFFYKLKKQGEGPREMKVGARTLITFESAAEWRRARE